MTRQILIYYAWSRPAETTAPLEIIEDRFPALFESRRMGFPQFHEFSDPRAFDQGIAGFLDHIMKHNFSAFVELATRLTGRGVVALERVADDGTQAPLSTAMLDGVDTLIIISFDAYRTLQAASDAEVEAVRQFLSDADHVAFICPHHDIGDAAGMADDEALPSRVAEFRHHGDRAIPARQQFGNFARTLLAGLGLPVKNRFGLRPSVEANGMPTPIEAEAALDRHGLLRNVTTFNLHPHLPQLERCEAACSALEVLARQRIDLTAPPHPLMNGRTTLDALLQTRRETFPGSLLVCDATLWSSTAGGVDSLRRFWTNVVTRPSGD